MKKIIAVGCILFSAMITTAQFTSANITASGLTCAMCTKAIYNALEKIPGVGKIDTDIKNSAFVVSFNQGIFVDPDILKSAVQDAGFSVAKFQLTGNFNSLKLKKDSHVNIGHRVFYFMNAADNSSLDGNHTITVVDKDFLSNRDFKKMKTATTYACIETGRALPCCAKDGIALNERIFHVTL